MGQVVDEYAYGYLNQNDEVVGTVRKNDEKREALLLLKTRGKTLDVLRRITIVIREDNMATLGGNNKILRNYDIIAVEPTNEKTLLQCVQSTEIDMISFDMSHRIMYPLRTSVSKQAVDKNVYFEISLRGCLKDSNLRRNLISNARKILESTRGKNIVLTSGADARLLLRGPNDLMNLGTLFGMSTSFCKKSVSTHCRDVYFHGKSRKTEKGILQVIPLKDAESWMLPETETDCQDDNNDKEEKDKKKKRKRE